MPWPHLRLCCASQGRKNTTISSKCLVGCLLPSCNRPPSHCCVGCSAFFKKGRRTCSVPRCVVQPARLHPSARSYPFSRGASQLMSFEFCPFLVWLFAGPYAKKDRLFHQASVGVLDHIGFSDSAWLASTLDSSRPPPFYIPCSISFVAF